jgi:RimJ/RimL family protein N-acetyltransferase
LDVVLTKRLEVRLPIEADRDRFVELFGDARFMEFSAGVHDLTSAHERFDTMLETAAQVPFAKQPVIERSSGEIIGYSGAAWCEFEGQQRLEYGYRLVPTARGKGYATEAGLALMEVASDTFHGELLAMIDPQNRASRGVITKLGFEYWKLGQFDGYQDELYRRAFP